MSEDALRAAQVQIVCDWMERGDETGRLDYGELVDALASSRPEPLDVAARIRALDEAMDRVLADATANGIIGAHVIRTEWRALSNAAREYDRLGDKRGQDAPRE